MDRLIDLSLHVGVDLLVNVDAAAPSGRIYKSAKLVGENGTLRSYQKSRLVPFGAYVPFRKVFGWTTHYTKVTKVADEDRQRDTGPVVLRISSPTTLVIGPLISYETTFSDRVHRKVKLGAELLVYLSSTSTFHGTWVQPQLAALPAVHVVEVGCPAVHVGLSGDSLAFDAGGRWLAWFPLGYQGVVVVTVSLASSAPLYQRLGYQVLVLIFRDPGLCAILLAPLLSR